MNSPTSAFRRPGSWLALVVLSTVVLQGALPPKPADQDFLHDYAAIIPEGTQQAIREHQAKTFQAVGIPIVVVTVPNLSLYDAGPPVIEVYARNWFNHWGIGSKQKNDGILILLAVDERSARIELGAAWGHRWDDYAQRVMAGKMVPRFKAGDYGAGLLAGLEALERMAARGALAEPPAATAVEQLMASPVGYYAVYDNPLQQHYGPGACWILMAAGIAILALVPFFPRQRKLLLIAGLGAIGLAFFFWITSVIISLLIPRRSDGGSGGGSAGGGFGGGSSGGGGATGKW